MNNINEDIIYKTRAIIIPHAGKLYAGDARKEAFKYIKNTINYIIYIAALHKPLKKNYNQIYKLHEDFGFPNIFVNISYNKNIAENEHSFKWVEKELRNKFPKAKILVLAPYSLRLHKLNVVSNIIATFINKREDSILIATTDLIHFYENHNIFDIQYPQQLEKIKKEEKMISDMIMIKNISKYR